MKHLRPLISLVLFLATLCHVARGATPAEVDAAVDKAKNWLLNQQKNGNWEVASGEKRPDCSPAIGGAQYSGLTALATYSLLCANVSRSDPHIIAALDFLSRTEPDGIYTLGLRCLLWSSLDKMNKAQHEAAHRDAEKLLNSVRSKGEAAGLYYYASLSAAGPPPAPGSDPAAYDHSVSQFAALGLWAMELQGFEVPGQFWVATDAAWRRHQYPDGAWSYTFNGDPRSYGKHTMSMTCAGTATLLIDEEILHKIDKEANGTDPAIDKGIAWLGANFDSLADPNSQNQKGWHIEPYTLFGVSRIGVAAGRKYLGNVDWYQRGADMMIRTQSPDGSWPGSLPASSNTSLALTFLTYGRAPVVLNKLRYDIIEDGKTITANWNRRPQDCRNFVEWMGTQLEQRLNWQVMNLGVPAEQLHEAPIIFISGRQGLALSPQDVDKLRQFVLQGGTILGNADDGNVNFIKGFEQLGAAMFPGSSFRRLPPTHPIFTSEQYRKWTTIPSMEGLSNGVREFMLLPKADLSRSLQARNIVLRESDYQLLDDIVLYTMDSHGLEEKGVTYLVSENAAAPIERQVKLARLEYNGNWDPEPYGWRRLAAILHNDQKIGLQVETVKLGDGRLTTPPAADNAARPSEKEIRQMATKRVPPADLVAAMADDPHKADALIAAKIAEIRAELDAADATRKAGSINYPIAHITGTDAITLTDAQRQDLKNYVEAGGMLVIDAAGGNADFAASMETALGQMFGATVASQLNQPIPQNDPLYSAGDQSITTFRYRTFARERLGLTKSPQLRGLTVNGRLGVILSREDLSAGLVGEQIDGIVGYTPETATAIMRNIILAASTR